MQKEKIVKIGIWVALLVVVAVAVITSIILHSKKEKLEDLKNKNDLVKPEESVNLKENKIILKNFEIFIDNYLYF